MTSKPLPRRWQADPSTSIVRRVGPSPSELGVSVTGETCPEVLQLENGDFALIGTDVTDLYRSRLAAVEGAACGPHEAIVMVPAITIQAAVAQLAPPVAGRHNGARAVEDRGQGREAKMPDNVKASAASSS